MTTASKSDQSTPRSRRREETRQRVFDVAVRLFAEKGYAATSPQDIADAAGLTRQAFYYYGFTKDELLTQIMEDLSTRTSLRLRATIADSTNYAMSLHNLVFLIVSDRAHNRARVRLLIRSESELPASLAESYTSARNEAVSLVRDVVEAGVAAGQFRAVDATVAVQSIIGMSDSVVWWFEPDEGRPVEPIAEEMARNAVEMLRVHPA
jgi:AcrR family transcriptional regulator